ncbi:MAG: hypothetical protein LC632_06670 [Xanthomonadaceae bacterium]|nr:hypothetical protein [Xanthomonadaceae bacterium]
MTRYALMTLLLLVVAAATPAYAEVPVPLAPYISADEFRAAGLHRLTPEELERFEHWFLRAVGAEPAIAADAAPDLEAERQQLVAERRALEEERNRLAVQAEKPDVDHPGLFGFGSLAARTPEIEATLDGSFTGWSRGTRFRLDNGQVWETVSAERFRPVRPVERPAVTIRRMAFGSFMLRVEGYNASVRVRRIE